MDSTRRMLFSDETENFCCPAEPNIGEKAVLRLRAAKDASLEAYLVHNEKRTPMVKADSNTFFDYYEAETPVLSEPFSYHFEIWDQAGIVFYNRLGLVGYVEEPYNFKLIPGFFVPEWSKGAVMYQIYTDRFCNGELSNDVVDREYLYLDGHAAHQVTAWNTLPEPMDVYNFYGGDLQGVWDKLDYLQNLGVEVLYFNPLFVSPSNHKYDVQDYDYIDPHLAKIVVDDPGVLPEGAVSNEEAGKYRVRSTDPRNLEASNQFFIAFMEEVHRRGMKVILDGVFNHCGSFHKWMDREHFYAKQGGYAPGAFGNPDSPYRNFFQFYSNVDYEAWWDHETLPKLNYEGSEELCQEVLRIAGKWVSEPFHVDGWRLDVAADLGHDPAFNHWFWRRFRDTVKQANPEALILAEHYGDASSWLNGDQWDTVMNYDAFMEPLTWFLTGMEKHSDEYREELYGNGQAFFETMRYNMSRFSYGALHSAMNELDNHDHSRFLTRTNRQVGRITKFGAEEASRNVRYGVYREAVVIQMTWPGAPTLYYGDETGVPGWTDPDSRRPFPWGRENWELIEFHRYMIALRKAHPALRRGSLYPLKADYQVIAYGRFLGEDQVVVAVNNSQEPRNVALHLDGMGIRNGGLIRRMETSEDGYNVGAKAMQTEDGLLDIRMNPVSAVILTVN